MTGEPQPTLVALSDDDAHVEVILQRGRRTLAGDGASPWASRGADVEAWIVSVGAACAALWSFAVAASLAS